MNKKGWGLTEMIVLCAVLVIALLIVGILVYTNFRNFTDGTSIEDEFVETGKDKEEAKSYDEIENKMIDAAKQYLGNNQNDSKTERIIVTLKTLEKNHLIDTIYDVKTGRSKCSGYVLIDKDSENISYKSYLKCSFKYTTKGYSAEYDE